MQRVAEALGVSTATVGRDLEGFSHDEKTSRPKGGRPKGTQKPKKDSHAAVVKLQDAGVPKADIAARHALPPPHRRGGLNAFLFGGGRIGRMRGAAAL
jgi:DeoR/GlpR family transcriptional regulator of sugar metabolism